MLRVSRTEGRRLLNPASIAAKVGKPTLHGRRLTLDEFRGWLAAKRMFWSVGIARARYEESLQAVYCAVYELDRAYG